MGKRSTKKSLESPFKGLSNEELLWVFNKSKKYITEIESKSDDERIKSFKESFYFKTAKSVVEKLEPLCNLILEVDEYKEINKNF